MAAMSDKKRDESKSYVVLLLTVCKPPELCNIYFNEIPPS